LYRALVLALAIAEAAASGSLVDAVARRDSGAVRSLLRQHADVNARDADGATALQWAAHWNDVETASLLIDAGAHVNTANDLGVSPLMLASTNGSVEMVNRLLDAGADPNRAARSGETVLMTAARTGTVGVVQALLDRGAAINAPEPNHGQTALMWAAAEKHPDITRELLARGAAPDLRSRTGFSALMFAAQQGDVASARLLLEAGADVNQTAADGNTPLLMASASLAAITASNYHILHRPSDHEAVAIALVERGADVSVPDSFGRTALHLAVETRKTQLVQALLSRGANPNARLTRGLPFRRGDYVSRGGYAGATPFWYAAKAADVALMKLLIAAGADANLGTQDNTSPLMAAVGMGEADSRLPPEAQVLEAVTFAIEAGSMVNAVQTRSGQSALHVAASIGRGSLIQCLVEHGAALDLADKQGRTPLAIADDPGRPRPEAAALIRSLTRSP
jgi:ankyrin repeat protein